MATVPGEWACPGEGHSAEGLRRVAGAKDPNAVHGAIILLADPPMCRRAFTSTAAGLRTPKRCEVNVRARAVIDSHLPLYYGVIGWRAGSAFGAC